MSKAPDGKAEALLRSLLFVPGVRKGMLARARDFKPDALVLDLEDSVPPAEKAGARALVRDAIPGLAGLGRQIWVRVNSTYTNLAKEDIQAVISPEVDGVIIPKADSLGIVRYVEALLRDHESRSGIDPGKVRLLASIETSGGLLRCAETATASSRLLGLCFGAEDFTADMGIERTPEGEELRYSRSVIAVAARSAGLIALDTVYTRLHDLDGLSRDARQARQAGFQGKLLIHPEQIEPVNRVFSPTEAEVAVARRVVQAYEQALVDGVGAVQVDGTMVDAPVAKRAQRLLDLLTQSSDAGPAPAPSRDEMRSAP